MFLSVVWCTGAKDKKAGGKGKVGDEDEEDRPRAIQVDLSVKLCRLNCDAVDTQHSAADVDS